MSAPIQEARAKASMEFLLLWRQIVSSGIAPQLEPYKDFIKTIYIQGFDKGVIEASLQIKQSMKMNGMWACITCGKPECNHK